MTKGTEEEGNRGGHGVREREGGEIMGRGKGENKDKKRNEEEEKKEGGDHLDEKREWNVNKDANKRRGERKRRRREEEEQIKEGGWIRKSRG